MVMAYLAVKPENDNETVGPINHRATPYVSVASSPLRPPPQVIFVPIHPSLDTPQPDVGVGARPRFARHCAAFLLTFREDLRMTVVAEQLASAPLKVHRWP